MQTYSKRGMMLTVRDGWASCPACRRNHRLLQVRPDTEARNLIVYCRACKREFKIDIVKGECFESQGR